MRSPTLLNERRGMDRQFSAFCIQLLENAGWTPHRAHVQSLAFTAYHAKSGVSTIALECAKVVAGLDRRVLLVDATARGNNLRQRLGVKSLIGLSEAIGDPTILRKVIRKTNITDVFYLGHGRSKRFATTSEPVMTDFIEEFVSSFDLVILDLPKLSANVPLHQWHSFVDGTVVIVKDNQLKPHEAQAADRVLKRHGAHVHGIVINQSDVSQRYQDPR